jgi:DNA polymerase epsilon subunit 1
MSSYKRGGPSFRGGSRGNTRFTGKKRHGGAAGGGGVAYGIDRPAPVREDDGSASAERFEEVRIWDEIDSKLGFERFESGSYEGEKRVGWLVNMHQVGGIARRARRVCGDGSGGAARPHRC